MSVGLLLVTHNRVGEALLGAATDMLGLCPLSTEALAVFPGSNPEGLLEEGRARVRRLDHGQGVLVLTDIYGSTPSNIATRLAETEHVAVVSGVNLSMLVRVLNYYKLDLSELAHKAISGGRDGILALSGCRGSAQDVAPAGHHHQ